MTTPTPVSESEYRDEFRERLKMTRLRMDMTLDEVAEEIGVTRQAVLLWENGRAWPKPKRRRRIRRWFADADEELERRR